MADMEEEVVEEVAAPVEEVVEEVPLDKTSALKQVLKRALCHDGLARGIRECAKMLDKRKVHLCVLADNCSETEYKKLVEALCTEHGITLMTVDDNTELGEWAGLCKIDADGTPRSIVKCSVAVVTDFGEDTRALNVLLEYLKSQN